MESNLYSLSFDHPLGKLVDLTLSSLRDHPPSHSHSVANARELARDVPMIDKLVYRFPAEVVAEIPNLHQQYTHLANDLDLKVLQWKHYGTIR